MPFKYAMHLVAFTTLKSIQEEFMFMNICDAIYMTYCSLSITVSIKFMDIVIWNVNLNNKHAIWSTNSNHCWCLVTKCRWLYLIMALFHCLTGNWFFWSTPSDEILQESKVWYWHWTAKVRLPKLLFHFISFNFHNTKWLLLVYYSCQAKRFSWLCRVFCSWGNARR